jgi:hypothetical protein
MNEATQLEEPISTAELAGKPGANNEAAGPLLPPEFVHDLRKRWDGIQTGFVDEPRAAVRQADELVASAIKRLVETFAEARNNLEGQWARGDEINTEDLRVALKKYRSFFQKLMSV